MNEHHQQDEDSHRDEHAPPADQHRHGEGAHHAEQAGVPREVGKLRSANGDTGGVLVG